MTSLFSHPHFVNESLTFFIKLKLATSLVAHLANGSLALLKDLQDAKTQYANNR